MCVRLVLLLSQLTFCVVYVVGLPWHELLSCHGDKVATAWDMKLNISFKFKDLCKLEVKMYVVSFVCKGL